MLAGIGRAAETVFGRKKSYYIKPVLKHDIQSVAVAHHAGMVGKQSHTLAAQAGHILAGACRTHRYLRCRRGHRGQKAQHYYR